jgi:hypothetical protein
MRITSRQDLLDKTGMWTSALCAIHCMAVPALVSMSAFSHWTFLHDERLEGVALVVGAILAISSLLPAYSKHHKNLLPIVVLLAGLILLALSRFLVNVSESIMTSSGATLVASAHFLNYRFCKKCHPVIPPMPTYAHDND